MSKHILVVDDREGIALILESRLTGSGYDVTVAFDRGEALERIADPVPDLIILDVVMPKIDGGELSHRLSKDSRHPDHFSHGPEDERRRGLRN